MPQCRGRVLLSTGVVFFFSLCHNHNLQDHSPVQKLTDRVYSSWTSQQRVCGWFKSTKSPHSYGKITPLWIIVTEVPHTAPATVFIALPRLCPRRVRRHCLSNADSSVRSVTSPLTHSDSSISPSLSPTFTQTKTTTPLFNLPLRNWAE